MSIEQKIANIAKSSKTLREQVQTVGIEIAKFMVERGNDASPVNLTRLVDAVSASANRKPLLVWIESFLPVTRKEAKEGVQDTFTVNGKKYVFGMKKERTYNIAAMEQVMWWEAARDPADQPITLDVHKAILAILKKAENANEIVHGEALETLPFSGSFGGCIKSRNPESLIAA